MSAVILQRPEFDGPLHRRAVALANIRWFRALAQRVLRDGGPQGALRAANARSAARILIAHAKRERAVSRMTRLALGEPVASAGVSSSPLPGTLDETPAYPSGNAR